MNSASTKVCPYCAETVPGTAKLCPRCRQWLSLRSFRHPAVVGALCGLIPILGCLCLLGLFADFVGNPKPYYSAYPDALKILQSKTQWVETKEGPRIFLTGILTNRSSIAWRDVEFDCRFFNSNGTLVDAANSFVYMTVGTNGDRAFRLSVKPVRPSADYFSNFVTVSTARNTRSRF